MCHYEPLIPPITSLSSPPPPGPLGQGYTATKKRVVPTIAFPAPLAGKTGYTLARSIEGARRDIDFLAVRKRYGTRRVQFVDYPPMAVLSLQCNRVNDARLSGMNPDTDH